MINCQLVEMYLMVGVMRNKNHGVDNVEIVYNLLLILSLLKLQLLLKISRSRHIIKEIKKLVLIKVLMIDSYQVDLVMLYIRMVLMVIKVIIVHGEQSSNIMLNILLIVLHLINQKYQYIIDIIQIKHILVVKILKVIMVVIDLLLLLQKHLVRSLMNRMKEI